VSVTLAVRARRTRLRIVLATASALVAAVALPGWAAADQAVPTDPVALGAEAVLAAVEALPPTPNTAYGLDPATDQVVLTVSDAAPSAGVARLYDLANRFAGLVRVERITKPLTEQDVPAPPLTTDAVSGEILGGDEINNGKIICSAGFNVVRGNRKYLITAGHCTAGLPDWLGVGPSVVSAFPNTDYGIIRNDSAYAPGGIDLYDGTMQPITDVRAATVGETVCASGQTTQVTCGHVTAVDQTVDYGDGSVVHDLIKTNVRTDHGDSGGPLFDGSIGLGTVSGGDGTTDYFQPLGAALTAYGLRLAP
jgi:streptogrisin D